MSSPEQRKSQGRVRKFHGVDKSSIPIFERAQANTETYGSKTMLQKAMQIADDYTNKSGPTIVPGIRHIPKKEFAEDFSNASEAVVHAGKVGLVAGAVATGAMLGSAQAQTPTQKAVTTIGELLEQRNQERGNLFKRLTPDQLEKFKQEKRGSISGEYKLNTEDIDHLTWNLFHEAKGENSDGLLGVLLTVLERARSPKFPGTVPGVIYQSKQFSWTWQNKNFFPLPDTGNVDPESKLNKKDYKLLLTIREFLQNYSKDKTIGELITAIKKKLEIPESDIILYYKKNTPEWDEAKTKEELEKLDLVPKLSETARKLFKTLIKSKTILRHDFYKDPPQTKKKK